MLRKSLLMAAAFLAAAGQLYAGQQTIQEKLEIKLRTNGAFLRAAAKIIAEDKSDAPSAILKLAESTREEALSHLKSGEYEFAVEDIDDSTRKAVHAIVLAKNSRDNGLRELVMKEEMTLLADREHSRKEAQLRKGVAEVEIFITTAERLLKDHSDEQAAVKLKETKEVFAASKARITQGDYDKAIEDISKAYKLATSTVKDIKRAQGDIVTFPKTAYSDPKDILAHEVKKNDAYALFASTIVKEGQDEPARLVSKGLAYREDALKAMKDGGEANAIAALKTSTELLIKALRASGN